MTEVTKETAELFKEMREESAKPTTQNKETKFQILPDGNYKGRVYIVTNTIANDKSPNYGRKKYEIQLTVTEGAEKGKMAYNHRIIMPYNFANKPADQNGKELQKWQTEVKAYLKKTDEILASCGVNTSDTDMDRFTLKIGENNRRNTTVSFTMKNGNVYINNVVKKDPEAANDLFSLPNGDDAPIK